MNPKTVEKLEEKIEEAVADVLQGTWRPHETVGGWLRFPETDRRK